MMIKICLGVLAAIYAVRAVANLTDPHMVFVDQWALAPSDENKSSLHLVGLSGVLCLGLALHLASGYFVNFAAQQVVLRVHLLVEVALLLLTIKDWSAKTRPMPEVLVLHCIFGTVCILGGFVAKK